MLHSPFPVFLIGFCIVGPSMSTIDSNIVTILQGGTMEISCVSSFSPPWTWYSRKVGTMKTLSIAGQEPHPKLNDPRYQFSHRENQYSLQVSNVKDSDAGKFICDGDTRITSILNVIR